MAFVGRELVRLGIGHDFIDGGDPANWAAKVTPQTRAIYLETLSNPLVRIPALDSALEFARAHNLVSMIDNTFATPVGFRAVDFGFDLSLHSCTKYLGGHSDLIAGCVLGSAAWIDRIVERAADFGGCLAPLDCYLLQRSIKTLGPRMRAHNENALALAEILSRHPRVARVAYAGLPSDPDHQRSRFLSGCGGILAFEMRDGVDAATRLFKRFEYVTVAPSLGGVETTITRPASTSHFNVSRAERQRLGISDGLLRLSVGIESIDDLARDFAQALEG
jgi:cystathionine gamma-synthase/cystathionine gamma-lyase/cystathionine beta-lyase